MLRKTLGISVVFLVVAVLFGDIGKVEGAERGSGHRRALADQKRNVFDLKRHYTLMIDGINVAGVLSIGGLDQLFAQLNAAHGQNSKQGGFIPQGGSGMVITRDWSNTLEWYNWRKAILDGRTDRRTISIIFYDDKGTEAGRINFYHCWPTKNILPSFNDKQSGHATEQITISWETHDIKV